MIGKIRDDRWLRTSAAAVLAGLSFAPAAYAQETTSHFAIREQPLATGLLALAQQAGISIAATHALIDRKTGKAVRGDLSARAALTQMLAGSGLHFVFVGPSAVRIVPEIEGRPGVTVDEASRHNSQTDDGAVVERRTCIGLNRLGLNGGGQWDLALRWVTA